MDTESFTGKIVLSLIEKILIGVLAYFLFLLLNAEYDESQRLREQSIAVSKIHSEILVDERSELIKLMREYFLVTRALQKSSSIEDEQLLKIENINYQIQTTLFNITTIDESVGSAGDQFVQRIDEFNKKLYYLEATMEKETMNSKNSIEGDIDNIRTSYALLLRTLRDASINAVRRDLAKRP